MDERHERRVQRKIVPGVVEIRCDGDQASAAVGAIDDGRLAGGKPCEQVASGRRRCGRSSGTSPGPARALRPANGSMTGWRTSPGASDRVASARAGLRRSDGQRSGERARRHLWIELRPDRHQRSSAALHVPGDRFTAAALEAARRQEHDCRITVEGRCDPTPTTATWPYLRLRTKRRSGRRPQSRDAGRTRRDRDRPWW